MVDFKKKEVKTVEFAGREHLRAVGYIRKNVANAPLNVNRKQVYVPVNVYDFVSEFTADRQAVRALNRLIDKRKPIIFELADNAVIAARYARLYSGKTFKTERWNGMLIDLVNAWAVILLQV